MDAELLGLLQLQRPGAVRRLLGHLDMEGAGVPSSDSLPYQPRAKAHPQAAEQAQGGNKSVGSPERGALILGGGQDARLCARQPAPRLLEGHHVAQPQLHRRVVAGKRHRPAALPQHAIWLSGWGSSAAKAHCQTYGVAAGIRGGAGELRPPSPSSPTLECPVRKANLAQKDAGLVRTLAGADVCHGRAAIPSSLFLFQACTCPSLSPARKPFPASLNLMLDP
mmetsp:Transcript_35861/g.101507  ORF Transcript_35861/g.101507 Transcript_35861/m.101507 type:complete len:223 (+) Transcript_35861:1673-2341(+)